MPAIGQPAPSFTLPRDGGTNVSLADYAGQIVVLYFYPKDDTPGCTIEAIDFSAEAEAFAKSGAVVLGVSRDTVKKHEKFRDKHGLKVALLADEDGAVCEAYGVWVEKSMYGRTYMGIERTTFLIGRDGKITRVWDKVKVKDHAAEVLAAVSGL
ncbi:MAG: thioredoxin-dependent thiol peroxidase [Marivivens sp.]